MYLANYYSTTTIITVIIVTSTIITTTIITAGTSLKAEALQRCKGWDEALVRIITSTETQMLSGHPAYDRDADALDPFRTWRNSSIDHSSDNGNNDDNTKVMMVIIMMVIIVMLSTIVYLHVDSCKGEERQHDFHCVHNNQY